MAAEVKEKLQYWFVGAKRIVVAGIGNPIRLDDKVGLTIIEGLRGKVRSNVLLLECETVPESYFPEIEQFKPTHVLLVDAAFLGLKPGESNLVDADKLIASSAISSHVLPLRIFCDLVRQATCAKVALLLVEPKSMEFGEGLSEEVQKAAENLTRILLNLLR